MLSLPIPDKHRAKLRDELKGLLESQLPVLQPVTQSDAIIAHHQGQRLFQKAGQLLDRTAQRVGRFHRAGYEPTQTPVDGGSVLRADQLAADGSPHAILKEIQKIREALCEDQAAHFVDRTMTDLSNLGAVGVIEDLANGGLKIRFLQSGIGVTVDAVPNGQTRSAHLVSFTRRMEGLMATPLKNLISVSPMICLQASDYQSNVVEVPQQFLMARLGPFAFATSPRLVPRPSLLTLATLHSPFSNRLNAVRRKRLSLPGVARSGALTSTLGLLGTGFASESSSGTSMLIAGSLLAVGSCLYTLNNQSS